MTAPIFFNVKEARVFLLENGFVYTCRPFRRTTGTTIARHGGFLKFIKLGKVKITQIKFIPNTYRLEPYLAQSGFTTLEEWVENLKDGLPPAWLYYVELIKEV